MNTHDRGRHKSTGAAWSSGCPAWTLDGPLKLGEDPAAQELTCEKADDYDLKAGCDNTLGLHTDDDVRQGGVPKEDDLIKVRVTFDTGFANLNWGKVVLKRDNSNIRL
jgi:hypothetical protein